MRTDHVLEESDRRITLVTLVREIKLLEMQEADEKVKYGSIHKKANLDVMGWLIEKEICDWKSLKKLAQERETDKDVSV